MILCAVCQARVAHQCRDRDSAVTDLDDLTSVINEVSDANKSERCVSCNDSQLQSDLRELAHDGQDCERWWGADC
jgi:hypothetical protein